MSIKKDFSIFQKGKKEIANYHCDEKMDGTTFNLSPTILYLNNIDVQKEFLVLMESWGEMKNQEDQKKLLEYIKRLFMKYPNLSSEYNLKFGRTCFHGNTSAAEGRELLNMNDEESYRAFLDLEMQPQYNIVKLKNNNGYHTIAGFSASKIYGSNYSNAEGFRRELGFKSRIFYENLKNKYKRNYENSYMAVYDESLIDSIFNESKLYKKVFAYALTINTHTPFVLDLNYISDKQHYEKIKDNLLSVFDQNEGAFNQFYRITSIIDHVFKSIHGNRKVFDRVLIVGDHANPDLKSRSLYNTDMVPYLYLERRP